MSGEREWLKKVKVQTNVAMTTMIMMMFAPKLIFEHKIFLSLYKNDGSCENFYKLGKFDNEFQVLFVQLFFSKKFEIILG